MAARLSKLTRENLERLAAGKPMKMRRGRLGLWIPGQPELPLQDIHPARYRSEHVEAATLFGVARVAGLANGNRLDEHLIHIANEGSASKARGAKLKAEGLQAGVHDYLFAYPTSRHHGLWIELKASDGTASDDQIKFAKRMKAAGYAACFAWGADAALQAIRSYLDLSWPK